MKYEGIKRGDLVRRPPVFRSSRSKCGVGIVTTTEIVNSTTYFTVYWTGTARTFVYNGLADYDLELIP